MDILKKNEPAVPAIVLMTDENRQQFVLEVTESILSALTSAGLSGIFTNRPADAAEPKDEWGTREDACALLKISFPSLHRLINEGALISEKTGRKRLVNLTDARRKLESGQLRKYGRR